MTRLFVGSFLKDEEAARVHAFVQENQDKLAALTRSKMRFVDPTNLHITWVFLGDVEDEKMGEIKKIMQRELDHLLNFEEVLENAFQPGKLPTKSGASRSRAFDIKFTYDYLESWPSVTQSRVLVATPNTVPDMVLRLGMNLKRALADMRGADVDRSETRNVFFRPHLTLARMNPPANLGNGILLGAFSEVLPVAHHIDCIHLIKSEVIDGASKYEIVESAY